MHHEPKCLGCRAAGAVQWRRAAGADAQPGAGVQGGPEPLLAVSSDSPVCAATLSRLSCVVSSGQDEGNQLCLGSCQPHDTTWSCRPIAGLISKWLPWLPIVAVHRSQDPVIQQEWDLGKALLCHVSKQARRDLSDSRHAGDLSPCHVWLHHEPHLDVRMRAGTPGCIAAACYDGCGKFQVDSCPYFVPRRSVGVPRQHAGAQRGRVLAGYGRHRAQHGHLRLPLHCLARRHRHSVRP